MLSLAYVSEMLSSIRPQLGQDLVGPTKNQNQNPITIYLSSDDFFHLLFAQQIFWSEGSALWIRRVPGGRGVYMPHGLGSRIIGRCIINTRVRILDHKEDTQCVHIK